MKLSSILPPSHSSFIKPSLFLHHSNDINGFRGVYPSVDLEKDTIVASYPLTQYYNPSPTTPVHSQAAQAPSNVNEGNPNDDGEDICTTDQQTIQLAEWLLEQCALNNQSKYYTWVNHLPTTLNVFDAKNIMHLLTTTTLTLSSTEEKDLLQENMIRTQIVRGKRNSESFRPSRPIHMIVRAAAVLFSFLWGWRVESIRVAWGSGQAGAVARKIPVFSLLKVSNAVYLTV